MTQSLLAVSMSVLIVTVAVHSRVPLDPAGQTQTAAVESEQEFARRAEALVEKTCNTSCHNLEKLDEARRTGREWSDQVGAMVVKGAIATDAQLAAIKKYLTRYYGLVAVNTATPAELSAVMGFSAKDAQAIIDYRTAHGKFADVDALLKVPGIDKSKIQEQPDALVFK